MNIATNPVPSFDRGGEIDRDSQSPASPLALRQQLQRPQGLTSDSVFILVVNMQAGIETASSKLTELEHKHGVKSTRSQN